MLVLKQVVVSSWSFLSFSFSVCFLNGRFELYGFIFFSLSLPCLFLEGGREEGRRWGGTKSSFNADSNVGHAHDKIVNFPSELFCRPRLYGFQWTSLGILSHLVPKSVWIHRIRTSNLSAQESLLSRYLKKNIGRVLLSFQMGTSSLDSCVYICYEHMCPTHCVSASWNSILCCASLEL